MAGETGLPCGAVEGRSPGLRRDARVVPAIVQCSAAYTVNTGCLLPGSC